MAVLTLNGIITSLSGRIGNWVCYMRRGTACARVYVKPGDPKTPAQENNRCMFAGAVRAWQQLSDTERKEYDRKARREFRGRYRRMSAYNIFISEHMKAELCSGTKPEPLQLLFSRHSIPNHLRFPSVSPSLPAGNSMQFAGIMPEFSADKAPPGSFPSQ